jgi:uncharacterized membrane protein
MRKFVLLAVVLLGLLAFAGAALAQSPVVYAVLFYSPACPHCHQVISEDIPPLIEAYGEQLMIIGIDITAPDGQMLYQAAIKRFELPEERVGVPCLVVGEHVLVGSLEIPEQFPMIVAEGLEQGGIFWPDIPELLELLQAEGMVTASEIRTEAVKKMTMIERFQLDVVGNSISVAVLLGLIVSFVWVGAKFIYFNGEAKILPSWIIPVLVILGLGLAAYMTFVEVRQSEAVCGPVGNCNAVHQSKYAYLFGAIPMGAFGFFGYLMIGVAWLVWRMRDDDLSKRSAYALFGMTAFGVLFSTYLTFLEPFVIGATCSWCLASAIVMVLLLWTVLPIVLQHRRVEQISLEDNKEL